MKFPQEQGQQQQPQLQNALSPTEETLRPAPLPPTNSATTANPNAEKKKLHLLCLHYLNDICKLRVLASNSSWS